MIKKLISLLLALLLMAAFYIYALMREDEQTKRTDEWVVAGENKQLAAFGGVESTDPRVLAQAMDSVLPLPGGLTGGSVRDSSYHGYYTRLLEATDGESVVFGVRPASASPMIRKAGLAFTHSEKTLLSYPLLWAEDDAYSYYYLVTDTAAFVLQLPKQSQSLALQGFQISQP